MNSLRNLLPEARFVCRLDDSKHARNLDVDQFTKLEVSSIRPISSIPAWVGKRAYEGRWWFSRTRGHVAFASAREKDVLTFLDFSGDIAQIARDPVIVIPARSDATPLIRPWLLIEDMTGARSLLLPHEDVLRSAELAAILRGHTVGVAEIYLPDAGEMRLVRWLAGYRFTRFTLPPQDEQQVRDVSSDASSVSATVTSAARMLPYSESAVRANLYSQIWRRTITLLDPRAGLSDLSKVVAA
ncbi:hypothetical protein [Microbacterium sp. Leaf179]|uniref:hypothetical protein n=1 Tax=Microbacterium sp. Leaf179 TaxID=1736288 RepID=UPI000ABFDCD4|nr:hypothetical protein [Microbacterium sp. Leaf179]